MPFPEEAPCPCRAEDGPQNVDPDNGLQILRDPKAVGALVRCLPMKAHEIVLEQFFSVKALRSQITLACVKDFQCQRIDERRRKERAEDKMGEAQVLSVLDAFAAAQ